MSTINFKFAKNWPRFITWHDSFKKHPPVWLAQKEFIQYLFEQTAPNIVDWRNLWKDFDKWLVGVYTKKKVVEWSEQRRQIETLLLNNATGENFIIVFLLNGKPHVDSQVMTYGEAMRVKKTLEGDDNGVGGNEDIENINVINLKKLLS